MPKVFARPAIGQKEMQKFKTILFDLDGTLADTLPLCILAFRKAIEPLINRSLSDQEIIATFGPSEEGTIMALASGHFDLGLESYLNHYRQLHSMCPEPFEGIPPILDNLKSKGVRLGLVTGKGQGSTDISLTQFDLHGYFENVETGWQHGPRKVAAIRNILTQHQLVPKQSVIYVGDSPSDIEASKKVGIPVVAAAWADSADSQLLDKLEPNALFHSVHDFSEWLEQRI
jgi:phosphoglycolate phosphatase/pyrophosphatase PpaX